MHQHQQPPKFGTERGGFGFVQMGSHFDGKGQKNFLGLSNDKNQQPILTTKKMLLLMTFLTQNHRF